MVKWLPFISKYL